MVSISTHSAACDLCIDLSATGHGVLILLEKQRTCTLSDYETVAVCIERTRSLLRVIVPGRESLHRVETTHSGRVYGGFRTACKNHVRLTPTDIIHGIDHRMIGRCTSRHGAIVRTSEAILHRDVSCSQVGDHFRDEERAVSGDKVSLDVALYLKVECFQTTYT